AARAPCIGAGGGGIGARRQTGGRAGAARRAGDRQCAGRRLRAVGVQGGMKLDLLGEVMLPLVRGGSVRVAAPLDAADLNRRRGERPVVETGLLEGSRALVAAEITLDPPPLGLDDDALALAVALYDALWLSHPEAQKRSPRTLERVARFAEKCAQISPARTR